jgi:hypothetical protein
MGAKVSNPKNNLQIQEPTEDIIEYEGYEEFPIIEIAKNIVMKNEKIRPNPSLNNHSGGSSIGKYESENYINKNKDKTENNEDENAKPKEESKFKKEQTDKKEENVNMDNNLNNDNNNIIINNIEEMKEPEKEDEKIDKLKSNNNNINTVEINLIDKKPEETDEINGGNFLNNDNNEINGNINDINNDINNDNIKEDINDKLNNGISEIKEEDINNENDEKEKLNTEENINNNNNNYEEKKIENEELNDINNNIENNLNLNEKEINNNEIKPENNVININDDFAPKKIILPDINTIISGKVLEEGAGNELLFMSYLNKIVHISIKDRVKYSQKFCITSKDNFFIYENKENYIQVKKPLAIIPICSIKNVVMFKLSKKVQSYDHFYIEFDLDENNKNNVYNKIDTFYENDLDNKTNENLNNTALVMFKTEEKNLAKEWYVLLKFLINLKLKK